ncbi:L-threonine dehydratase catabolic TdcB-like [Phlebotomus argentipes]|uniref:L-threonine dehydratase catabolic TdcB-like n=1 Tax=Phlebotomus argentipes TaxID=94469 RepID=UPI002892B003|nr:L-threonine dehydratase catabolic TdcB-like [Phlebotomus argentipes]XP_059617878.1 L-threonine dehydratase catabolic TdcB-like [Phlebotomus argentipes]
MTSCTQLENGDIIAAKKAIQLTNGHTNGTNGINGTEHIEFTDEDFEIIEDVEDPYCVADNPVKISFQDITSAAFLIKSGVQNTPCLRSHLSEMTGMDLYLKKEFLQFTGSFKERGARYALLMLSDQQKRTGVISASLGNHAQGLSYHANRLGIPVTVVMPTAAPIMKIQKCRSYGANVIVKGDNMSEAKKIAMTIAKRRGFTYVNGYDHPHIMAGQGTIGLEIIEQVGQPDAVVVPVGGGGLIAGVATAIKAISPMTKIIGVESDKCPSFSRALEHGGPILTPNMATLADGLAVPTVGYNAFATAVPLLDKMVVVREEWIALAILRLVEQEKCVVEGAGAAGLAAIFSGHLDEYKGKKVVLLLCGGNIDTTIFGRCLERGLAAEGRLLRFCVTVSDRPGGISELCRELAALGVSIKDIMHERAWLRDIYSVEVKVVCETSDWAHSELLRKTLTEKYSHVVFNDVPMAIPK